MRDPRDIENLYPLSPVQKGLLFHALHSPGADPYLVQSVYELHGEVNPAALRSAFEAVVSRHGVLRTAFNWESRQEPFQVVYRKVRTPWFEQDWSEMAGTAWDEQLESFLQADRAAGFNMARPPLLRAALIRRTETEYRFLWTHHHILLDGWSTPLLFKELAAFYEAFLRGEELVLPQPRPFSDYIAWIRRQDAAKAEAFWRGALGDLTQPTGLPLIVPGGEAGEGYHERRALLSDLSDSLKAFARRHRLTLNTLLQAAWALLLGRLTGEREAVFGVTVSGRPAELPGVESMIGVFINTLPLRVTLTEETPVFAWLERLQKHQFEMRELEQTPLVEIQGWSGVPRGQALFESVIVFESFPVEQAVRESGERLGFRQAAWTVRMSYPLALTAWPDPELMIDIQADASQFDAAVAARLTDYLTRALVGLMADSQRPLGDLSLLGEMEIHQLRVEWDGGPPVAPAACVHELFRCQARRSPDATALLFEGRSLTYGELDRVSDRLAWNLLGLGVKPESLVGLAAERSLELIVGVLGILKAGGAYVPIDPELPPDRILFLLRSSGASLLLTQGRLQPTLPPDLPGSGVAVVLLEDCLSEVGGPAGIPDVGTLPDHPVYAIYTSGSTGRPKGVLVSHRALVNRMQANLSEFPIRPEDRALQQTPITFDVAVSEIFSALLAGATLVVARPGGHRNPEYLAEIIRYQGVTLLEIVPSQLRALLDAGLEGCRTLRRVFIGAEALTADLQQRFFACLDAELVNLYGPTEATIDMTAWRCRSFAGSLPPPIGRPIAGVSVRILDAGLRPVPAGAVVELYIGGEGLARGYLGSPDLTAESFLPDPGEPACRRLYRTGDRARYRWDGAIEFLGRRDSQVKIRGMRVELEEIEEALLEVSGIRQALVLVREHGPENGLLTAYVVASRESADFEAWRSVLAARLPSHMVPARFVRLDSFPLLPSGKIDRRALPAPEQPVSSQRQDPPRNPVEEIVAGIWSDLLGLRAVGPKDNFFDLGGHSLLAMRVVSRVRAALVVELPLQAVFERPTLEALCSLLRESMAGAPASPPLAPEERTGPLPLSFSQQRLWFVDRLNPGSTLYNIPLALRLNGPLSFEALAQSFTRIVQRHEVLRTVFLEVGGAPVQSVLPSGPCELPLADLAGLPPELREREVMRLAREERRRPFDLRNGPLLRTVLLRAGSGDHALLVTIHHIVADGWSMAVLVREIGELYMAFLEQRPDPLTRLRIQYADYAAWQRQWLQGEALDPLLHYWRGRLAGSPELLGLNDLPRSPLPGHLGANHFFTLPEEVRERARELGRREGSTLFMVALAAFDALLFRYTGREDLWVGTVTANRDREETEGLIGCFINTLVLRTPVSGDLDFRELLRRIKETAIGAFAHQDLPFERLVEALSPERSLDHTPLFQVAFLLDNTPESTIQLEELELQPLSIEHEMSKFELSLTLTESEDGLVGAVLYRTDLFTAKAVRRLADGFIAVLTQGVEKPDTKLKALELIRSDDRAASLAASRQRFQALRSKPVKQGQPGRP